MQGGIIEKANGRQQQFYLIEFICLNLAFRCYPQDTDIKQSGLINVKTNNNNK